MYNYCEGVFFANGPFFHIYTTPPEKDLLFVQDEDYREATNMLAFASEDSGVRILAYAIMSNHLHIILSAGRERCDAFIAELHRKTNHFIRKRGRAASSISFNILEIKDIKQMKDEIAYVIRNPYVARNDVNPFAHPWSSGYLYFNEMLSMSPQGTPATNLSIRARRDLKHSRDAEMPSSFKVSNGMILPQSFVDYQMAMSFFENARQFVWYSTRKVEAYTATAERLGEKMLLTDESQAGLAKNGYLSINREIFRETGYQAVDYLNSISVSAHFEEGGHPSKNRVTFTKKHIDQLEQTLLNCTTMKYTDPDIEKILVEEMPAYFSGQKSLEETAKIARDRVQKVLDERR